jgi:hypothetical protein
MGTNWQYFPELIGEVVAKANIKLANTVGYTGGALVYEYGTLIELAKVTALRNSISAQKYPLVWLVWERPENLKKFVGTDANKAYQVSPLIFIAANTDQNYLSSERYDAVFKPVLIPIYEALLAAIKSHRNFNTKNEITHTQYEHFFWGMNDNGQNVLTDYLDAIELKFENLEIIKTC